MSRPGRSVVPRAGDGALIGRAFGSVRTPRAVAKGNVGDCHSAGPRALTGSPLSRDHARAGYILICPRLSGWSHSGTAAICPEDGAGSPAFNDVQGPG